VFGGVFDDDFDGNSLPLGDKDIESVRTADVNGDRDVDAFA
jgi:hypothetical protein